MELNNIIEYDSKRFDNEFDMIEYANNQIKNNKFLHSFSHRYDISGSYIIAVFVKKTKPNYNYKHVEAKEPIPAELTIEYLDKRQIYCV